MSNDPRRGDIADPPADGGRQDVRPPDRALAEHLAVPVVAYVAAGQRPAPLDGLPPQHLAALVVVLAGAADAAKLLAAVTGAARRVQAVPGSATSARAVAERLAVPVAAYVAAGQRAAPLDGLPPQHLAALVVVLAEVADAAKLLAAVTGAGRAAPRVKRRRRRTRGGHRYPCRCEQRCRPADREYDRRVARQKAYGLWQPYADADPVRQHVRNLMAQRIGAPQVAALAGVPPSTVRHLLYGHPARGEPPSARIRARTAELLLAVGAVEQNLAPGALTGAAGTRRRLQALVAAGWSEARLAKLLGMSCYQVSVITRGLAEVTAGTARRVRELCDELWDKAPPQATAGERQSVSKALAHAARRDWPPLMAWDDDDTDGHGIDNPAAAPAPNWRRGRTRHSAGLAADAAELQARHYSLRQAAERIGVTPDHLGKAISRTAERAA